MKWEQRWAAVAFTGQGGRYERFLQSAAEQGVHLRGIRPLTGGFSAVCPARSYRRLRPLARRCRVRLRLTGRMGIYFGIRGLLRRTGCLAGLAVGAVLLWQLQRLVWTVDCVDMTTGQAARALQALRSAGLQPGACVTQELLAAGESALLAMEGEFSWAGVNFEKGRVTVETAAAKPVPSIDSEEVMPLVAKADGVILSIEPEDGTPLVAKGQTVEKGQLLIGVARAERDGSLNYRRAAGAVLARVEWQGSAECALALDAECLTGESVTWLEFFAAGKTLAWAKPDGLLETSLTRQRHTQLSVFGLPLPVTVVEHTAFLRERQQASLSETLARDTARLLCQKQLYAEFPDAELLAWQEQEAQENGVLTLTVTAVIRADIAARPG